MTPRSSRQVFVVSYDISDPKRLRRVYELMCGWGAHIQLSVFRCELDSTELVELQTELKDLIHHQEDQVLFIYLGPSRGRARNAISALGRPCHIDPERVVIV